MGGGRGTAGGHPQFSSEPIRISVQPLLDRPRRALEEHTIGLDAHVLLDRADERRALGLAARVLPAPRHQTVAQLIGLVRLVRDDAVGLRAVLLGESLPAVLANPSIGLRADAGLNLGGGLLPEPAILVDHLLGLRGSGLR